MVVLATPGLQVARLGLVLRPGQRGQVQHRAARGGGEVVVADLSPRDRELEVSAVHHQDATGRLDAGQGQEQQSGHQEVHLLPLIACRPSRAASNRAYLNPDGLAAEV